jgi:hypothetical protein
MDLIEQNHFFIIHSPRQSGKTTLLQTLDQQINAAGKYYALYCSLESVQGMDELERGIPAILACLNSALDDHPKLHSKAVKTISQESANMALRNFLKNLCARLDRPLVIFFDEADCLGGETLISFLRQLRDGYVNRGRIPFVHSLALVGMRNIRDYRVQVRPDHQTLGSASPFNIAKAAMTLNYFTRDEIADLYQQHTNDTGQAFPPKLVDSVFHLTQGQPWLVNAIAAEIIEKMCQNKVGMTLTATMAEEAAQRIILRRDTHIDSLLERLKEPRVQRIIEPVLCGEKATLDRLSNDFQFVRDLGLIRSDAGIIRLANPIYNEVIARTLNYNAQEDLPPELTHRWMDAKQINVTGLLKGFQEFWRDNSEAWQERFEYKEAAPHLILLAYLQRVVNGGAKITREFATGTRRVDVCVEYAKMRYPIEMKLRRGPKTRDEGLTQLAQYMDTLGSKVGWLVLFSTRKRMSWKERITWTTIHREERTIHVVGV